MIQRILNPSLKHSFFLFGARGTGKSTLLRSLFNGKQVVWLDLLSPDLEDRYCVSPELLKQEIFAQKPMPKWVVIDEVQKVPALLDVAHQLIENHHIQFALTGSSARKLKRGGANLLAGRAHVFHLFPFSSFELGPHFDLRSALEWGTLPSVALEQDLQEKRRTLRAYALTYLKEEIQTEQLIRQMEPFRKFLPVAAQQNGQILNYSSIAREAGIESKTVERYFDILEDTHLGFRLQAHHRSVRKQQALKPKFFFFDLGVCRALSRHLDIPLHPGTSAYGQFFEDWIILECHRLNESMEKEFQLSYLRTKDGAEIDLIIERPGKSTLLLEVKSKNRVHLEDLRHLRSLSGGFRKPECWVLCQEVTPRLLDGIRILPWRDGLKEIFEME